MYYVWTVNGPTKLRVAGADSLKVAMYYAQQYTEEGDVEIKYKNKIVAKIKQEME